MLIWVLLSIFGIISGQIFYQRAHTLRVISQTTLGLCKIFLPSVMIGLCFFGKKSHYFAILILIFINIAPLILMSMNFRFRRKSFASLHLRFVDELILRMRIGKSLRESLREACGLMVYQKSKDLNELYSVLETYKPEKQPELLPEALIFLREIAKWDRGQVKIIEKIRFYRQQLKQSEKFRQKSRQVTEQTRAQALVCTFLYLILILWVGFQNSSDLVSVSALISYGFFLLGLMLLYFISRSFKWKT